MKIWSGNYVLHFGSIKIQKKICLYCNVFSTDTNRKIICYCLLLSSYFCWLVNCMIWVSKFHNLFLTRSETEARYIFEGFHYCDLWIYDQSFIQLSSTLLAIFIWSVNCSSLFLAFLFVIKLNDLNFWII